MGRERLKQVVHDGAYQFRVGPDSATDGGLRHGAGARRHHPAVQSVTVQPDQVVFTAGQTLDLTGANPWIAPDTNAALEQHHAPADDIVEAADDDQSFADLSHATCPLPHQRPAGRHGQRAPAWSPCARPAPRRSR